MLSILILASSLDSCLYAFVSRCSVRTCIAYCSVSMIAGPRFLSVGFMTNDLFSLRALSVRDCGFVRFLKLILLYFEIKAFC